MGAYDASAPHAAAGADPLELLRRMEADDSERRMLAFLEGLDEWIDESRAREREEGLDPDIAATLHAITARDDAPLEYRSLHRRVKEGLLTWQDFWLAPEDHSGGSRLVNEAMKAEGARLAETLRGFAEEDEEEPPPARGGVLGR